MLSLTWTSAVVKWINRTVDCIKRWVKCPDQKHFRVILQKKSSVHIIPNNSPIVPRGFLFNFESNRGDTSFCWERKTWFMYVLFLPLQHNAKCVDELVGLIENRKAGTWIQNPMFKRERKGGGELTRVGGGGGAYTMELHNGAFYCGILYFIYRLAEWWQVFLLVMYWNVACNVIVIICN